MKCNNLFRAGLCFFIYVSGDVAQCETSDRVSESCASDVIYSEGVRGDIRLDDDSIESAFNLSHPSRSYNARDLKHPMDTWIYRDRSMKIQWTK